MKEYDETKSDGPPAKKRLKIDKSPPLEAVHDDEEEDEEEDETKSSGPPAKKRLKIDKSSRLEAVYDDEEEDEEEDKPNIDPYQNTINKIEPIQNVLTICPKGTRLEILKVIKILMKKEPMSIIPIIMLLK